MRVPEDGHPAAEQRRESRRPMTEGDLRVVHVVALRERHRVRPEAVDQVVANHQPGDEVRGLVLVGAEATLHAPAHPSQDERQCANQEEDAPRGGSAPCGGPWIGRSGGGVHNERGGRAGGIGTRLTGNPGQFREDPCRPSPPCSMSGPPRIQENCHARRPRTGRLGRPPHDRPRRGPVRARDRRARRRGCGSVPPSRPGTWNAPSRRRAATTPTRWRRSPTGRGRRTGSASRSGYGTRCSRWTPSTRRPARRWGSPRTGSRASGSGTTTGVPDETRAGSRRTSSTSASSRR